jgi:hypothetical protein
MDQLRFDAVPLIAFIKAMESDYGTETEGQICQDAVRIALTSGLTRKQVADHLGVGM